MPLKIINSNPFPNITGNKTKPVIRSVAPVARTVTTTQVAKTTTTPAKATKRKGCSSCARRR